MTSSLKDEVIHCWSSTDDSTIEDVQCHLYVIDKVRKGLESVERDDSMTQEQVDKRPSKWLVG